MADSTEDRLVVRAEAFVRDGFSLQTSVLLAASGLGLEVDANGVLDDFDSSTLREFARVALRKDN